jgi:hypothetical protein
MYAPVTNNYGTRATAYLGNRRAGLIMGGRRAIFEDGKVMAVSSGPVPALRAVLPIVPGLGGGFLFAGDAALYFADSFDGPLRRLSADATGFAGLAPRAVFLSHGGGFVSTTDGLRISSAPANADRVFAHRRGQTVAISEVPRYKAWLTTDGRTWKLIAIPHVQTAAEDGDELLLFTESSTLRVGTNGVVTPVKFSAEDAFQRKLAGALWMDAPRAPSPDDGFEGALIDQGWSPTGRRDDEWMHVRDEQIFLTHARTHDLIPLGPKIGRAGDEGCEAAMLPGQPVLICFAMGTRLRTARLDLATGTTRLERTIDVKQGVAQRLGSWPGAYPTALLASATCEGDGEGGFCIRDDRGMWSTFPKLPIGVQPLPFPGELLGISYDHENAVRLYRGAVLVRTFAVPEIKPVWDAMGGAARSAGGEDGTGSAKAMPDVSMTGVLRTPTGIRLFYGPNPFQPIVRGRSYALDLPLDPNAPPSLASVDGVVAPAGKHALQLAGGKLWESNDGWKTWYEVDPPPTGVPGDLAGAMCSDRGCLLDGWARIGWQRAESP